MSTTEEALRVKILDAKKAETELRGVRKELEHVSGTTRTHTRDQQRQASATEHVHKSFSRLKNVLSYGGGLLGISAVGYGLKDITEGGVRAQEQQLLLRQALRSTGQAGSKHMGELGRAINETTSHGGFGALEETEGLSQFIRLTKSSNQAIKLNAEAITLARGAHMGYSRSLQIVRRIQTGQVGRLQQYLGIIQPVKYYVDQLTESEKKRFPNRLKEAELLDKEATAREANKRVLERYGGALQAYNSSAAGSISNANNAFKRATEQLGEKLLPAITDAAKGFSSLITEIEEGKGTWKTVGHDASTFAGDLKEVWTFFERNRTALKGLEVGLGILGAAWGTEKALKFVDALKELELAKLALGSGGGIAELAGAGGLAEAVGAGGLAGLLGPGAVAAIVGAALVPGSAKAIHEAAELLSPGYLKRHSVKEMTKLLAGGGSGKGFHVNSRGELEPLKKGERGFGRTEAGAVGHPIPEARPRPVTIGGRTYYPNPGETINTPEGQLRVNLGDTHIYLDGKQIATVVGEHAKRDPRVGRHYAEAVTSYAQKKKAREG